MVGISGTHPWIEVKRVWGWTCPVRGCKHTSHGGKSGSRKPLKHTIAVKNGRLHMEEQHPKSDLKAIIKKVK
jgi:hypothetical protein